MCLVVSRTQKEIVAPENYYVYKTVSKNLKSSIMGFKYRVGKKYTTEFGKQAINGCIVYNEGFHFHKSIQIALMYWHSEQLILECVVPKGATYIHNGQVGVTNKLVVVRKLTLAQAKAKFKKSKIK